MNFIKKILFFLSPKKGKTVIHFTTHGCMGNIHEFDYIGEIIDTFYWGGNYYHKVKVLKDKTGWELRDNLTEEKIKEVPSWYCQDLGGDFFIAYD